MNDDIYKLTEPEKEKAFKRLEQAVRKCEELGICLINIDGNIYTFDSKYVDGYGIRKWGGNYMPDWYKNKALHFYSDGLEAYDPDDFGYISLTEEGLELYNS